MNSLDYIAPFVGGLALEAVYWYQLREKMHLQKYRKMLTSIWYWGPVLAMAIFGGLVGIVWGVSQDAVPTPIELLFVGAAAPSLLKNVGAATTAGQATKLGPADDTADPQAEPTFELRDYLSPR